MPDAICSSLSVGGLLGRDEWFQKASEKGCRIYVPSGAIAGLDGVKSASMGQVKSAVLTSRKPVAALKGITYVVDHNVPLENFKEETVIFEGSAEEAARAFPTTSNVAASLRLALERTVPVCVRVVAVPGGTRNDMRFVSRENSDGFQWMSKTCRRRPIRELLSSQPFRLSRPWRV